MVFHYTNYCMETNAYWVRKVRPICYGISAGYFFYIYYRYYFFGKFAALKRRMYTQEQEIQYAQDNKKNWGYNSLYKPTLEISFKHELYQNPKYEPFQKHYYNRYMEDSRKTEDILDEWENYECPYKN